jgi:hypothetical protein
MPLGLGVMARYRAPTAAKLVPYGRRFTYQFNLMIFGLSKSADTPTEDQQEEGYRAN